MGTKGHRFFGFRKGISVGKLGVEIKMQMENISSGANGDSTRAGLQGCVDLSLGTSLLFPAVCRAPQVSAVPRTLSTSGHS